jgi:threonine dehydrogenase-like Zn-dependent dehydrogenase
MMSLGATHTINAKKDDPVAAIHAITNGRGVDVAVEVSPPTEINLN